MVWAPTMTQAVREAGLKFRIGKRQYRLWWGGIVFGDHLSMRGYLFPWHRLYWRDGRTDWLMEEVKRLRHRIRDLEYEVVPTRSPNPADDIDQFKPHS